MNETIRGLLSRIMRIWQRFTPGQRRNLLIAFAAGLVCVVAIVVWLSRPHYVTVLSGLDAQSLAEADAKLHDLKIPDQIEGSSILVPAAQADAARVQLAMAGLPKSGYIGYDSISNSLGMTQDAFNIQVLDVLQRSLAQTIESIDGVEQAQVHIVMPNQQLFVSEPQDTAKASVFLQLSPGVQLTPAQVAGIQQLVAHSVKGLTADNVTVVDQRGVTLSSAGDGTLGGQAAGSNEIAIRQELERQLTDELTAGLNQIVGPGNAVVMVHANVSFDQVQTKSHVVQPVPGQKTGLPTSSQQTQRQSTSTGGAAGGLAGQSSTNPNLPTYAGNTGNTGSSSSSETDSSVTYDNSYTDTTKVNDPIQINGYTVGVFLNSANKNIDPAMMDQIRSFVQSAVGARSPGPNDITVAAVPFQTGASSPGPGLPRWWPWAAGAATALLLAVLLVLWLRSRRRDGGADTPAPAAVEVSEEAPQSEPEVPSQEAQVREQLAQLARKNPDEFANLVRVWLSED